MKNKTRGPKAVLAFALALGMVLMANSAFAQCRLDWNQDWDITETDYLVGDPMGGFYAEWYIHLYYPSYYPVLFPTGDTSRLDYNRDGVVDQDDLMGSLDAVADTEGFYVEWYIWMFYNGYYPVFFPEYVTDCDNVAVIPSPATLPDSFYYNLANKWFFQVSRDGSLVGGIDTSNSTGFVFSTTDFVTNPASSAYYEYLAGEVVRDIVDISDDNNIILATIQMSIDGEIVDGGAYYNRSTATWTHLGAPEPGIDLGSCHFYPKAAGMSGDGNLIYGSTPTAANPCGIKGFVYNVTTDTWTLIDGVVPFETAKMLGGNKDASILFGWEQRDAEIVDGEIIHYGGQVPLLWTLENDGTYTAEWLGLEPPGRAIGCSYNGDYIVGSDFQQGMIWDMDGNVVLTMPKLAERAAEANAISDNGDFTVGSHNKGAGYGDHFVRREGYKSGQMTLLTTYMTDYGITDFMGSPGGFTPVSVSSDGKVIVGMTGGGPSPRFAHLAVIDTGM